MSKFSFDTWTPAEANEFLQDRLTSPSVVVSKLHPIMQGRLVAGFQKFEKQNPGTRLRILSGVRTYAQQVYLYNLYGSPRAANPNYSRGNDFERIPVKGSLHMEQRRGNQKPTGWAVDFERPAVGWRPVWDVFEPLGIVFVLRRLSGRAMEEWHATVRGMNGWYPGPFPTVPGMWRRLFLHDIGEDVKGLQKQLGGLSVDGHFGQATRNRVIVVQGEIGAKQDGNWGKRDQKRWEARHSAPESPAPAPPVESAPKLTISRPAAIRAIAKAGKDDVQMLKANPGNPETVSSSAALLDQRLDQIIRVSKDG